MKILHIVPTYLPAYRYGGPIESVHALNKALVRAGAEVTVFTTDIDGPGRLDVPIGVPVIKDGVRVFYFKHSRFLRAWEYARGLHRALAREAGNFDIIHITSVFLSASTLGARYAKRAGVPYLISPRGNLMKEPLAMKSGLKKSAYLSLLEKRNLVGASAIHFTMEKERQEYIEAGFSMRKSYVIPNIFDPASLPEPASGFSIRRKHNISPEVPVVLFLGRLSWKKGFDTLIPAWNAVKEKMPRVVLLIAGGDDERYRKTIERMIDEARVRESVVFTGILQGGEKTVAYRESDLFVLPSYSENFGMAVVEAMHCGLPVIVTENVGLAPDVLEAEAGRVVAKDAGELARAILETLENKKRASLMGRRGHDFVAGVYSADRVAERFLAAYNEVVRE